MKIQILGSGCPTCKKLHQLVEEVVSEEELEAEVEYISGSEGVQKIMDLGVMSSPALTVDGQVVSIGLPTKKEIAAKLVE
jgi:small redox-active disulfide protein 2